MTDYKKLYEDANKRVATRFGSNVARELFPDLYESEDERIRKWLIWYFNQYIVDGMPTVFSNGLNVKDVIAWLEKQGSQIHANSAKTCKDEQKPADKIEPKFKVGDWVINKHGFAMQIVAVQDSHYVYMYEGKELSATIEQMENSCHIWTIQDAKDGDVLVDEDNNIGLYLKENDDLYWHSCIYLSCDNRLRGFNIGGYHKHKNTKPATKEQRDTLLKAMAEAGYTFDFEKKELKKIDPCSGCTNDKGCINCENGNLKETEKSAWSEEDDEMMKDIIDTIQSLLNTNESWSYLEDHLDWLKSLKDRI